VQTTVGEDAEALVHAKGFLSVLEKPPPSSIQLSAEYVRIASTFFIMYVILQLRIEVRVYIR
jgi:hypothetical protein